MIFSILNPLPQEVGVVGNIMQYTMCLFETRHGNWVMHGTGETGLQIAVSPYIDYTMALCTDLDLSIDT